MSKMGRSLVATAYMERKQLYKLKPSMFNRIVETDDGLTLYNSSKGTKSILRVSFRNSAKVRSLLTQTEVLNDGSDIIRKLISAGYLVPENLDEKALRSCLQMEYLTCSILHLVIHVTRACNFRCIYCYMDFEPVFLTKDTQQGIINFVRNNIHKYSGVRISWFGGEPLLGVDIIENVSNELLAICKAHRKPYSASITTNGYRLTPDVYERLVRCRVKNFTITIDGKKELHDKQRVLADGGPTFDTIINNLLYIKSNYKNLMQRFNLRTNITKDHYNSLTEHYDYLTQLFGDDKRFQFFIRGVADYGGERVKALTSKMTDGLYDAYKLLSKSDIKSSFYTHFSDLAVGGSTCVAKRVNKYTIGCLGSVCKCDEDLEAAPLGFLDASGKMELDETSVAEWTGIKNISAECDDCFFSCCCMMEQCPLRRYEKERICGIDFAEIDALIEFAGLAMNVECL